MSEIASPALPALTVEVNGEKFTINDLSEAARLLVPALESEDGAALKSDAAEVVRLTWGLTLMVEKLADLRRNDLDAVIARVKALEDDRTAQVSRAKPASGWRYDVDAAPLAETVEVAIESDDRAVVALGYRATSGWGSLTLGLPDDFRPYAWRPIPVPPKNPGARP